MSPRQQTIAVGKGLLVIVVCAIVILALAFVLPWLVHTFISLIESGWEAA